MVLSVLALGIAPPALAPYAEQICPCLRQRLDTDHLHTCSKHSGKWYGAHELILSAVADIAHAAGFRTNRGSRVPTSRGQRRGDLEIKGLNVAGTTDLIVDVALVHDFHGNVVDPSRRGQPRHPNPDKVLIDTAVAKAHGNAYRYRPDYRYCNQFICHNLSPSLNTITYKPWPPNFSSHLILLHSFSPAHIRSHR
jgi:hypothetical protein